MSRCEKFQSLIKEGRQAEAIYELIKEYLNDNSYSGAFYNLGLAFQSIGLLQIAKAFFSYYLEAEPEGYWSLRAKEEIDKISKPNESQGKE